MRLLLPVRRIVDKKWETALDDLTTALEDVEFFVFPENGVILYEGTVPPEGWEEDTAIVAPEPEYMYIRMSQ